MKKDFQKLNVKKKSFTMPFRSNNCILNRYFSLFKKRKKIENLVKVMILHNVIIKEGSSMPTRLNKEDLEEKKENFSSFLRCFFFDFSRKKE